MIGLGDVRASGKRVAFWFGTRGGGDSVEWTERLYEY
jgi:hypothetical protein